MGGCGSSLKSRRPAAPGIVRMTPSEIAAIDGKGALLIGGRVVPVREEAALEAALREHGVRTPSGWIEIAGGRHACLRGALNVESVCFADETTINVTGGAFGARTYRFGARGEAAVVCTGTIRARNDVSIGNTTNTITNTFTTAPAGPPRDELGFGVTHL